LIAQQGQTILKESAPEGGVPVTPGQDLAIHAGDKITIEVWLRDRMSQLSGYPFKTTIPESGSIFLPNLGNWAIVNKTPPQLTAELQAALSKILSEASVVINLERARVEGFAGQASVELGKHVLVMGRVSNPGLFPLSGGMRVRDAVTLAGGLARGAQPNVFLVRGDSGQPQVLRIQMMDIFTGRDMSKNLLLEPRDALFVDTRLVYSLADFITTLLTPVVSIRDGIWVYDRLSGRSD
jgi:protein involved in polysaccharide export with SLBB domain